MQAVYLLYNLADSVVYLNLYSPSIFLQIVETYYFYDILSELFQSVIHENFRVLWIRWLQSNVGRKLETNYTFTCFTIFYEKSGWLRKQTCNSWAFSIYFMAKGFKSTTGSTWTNELRIFDDFLKVISLKYCLIWNPPFLHGLYFTKPCFSAKSCV